MNFKFIYTTLMAAALLVSADGSLAYDHESERPAQASSKAGAKVENKASSKAAIAAKAKAAAKIKKVDINTANKAALTKLPGITDVEAEKIIANRPYGSKAWLVTNKVLDAGAYGAIKALIEAKQPLKPVKNNPVSPKKSQ